jgi:hypothetical protein
LPEENVISIDEHISVITKLEALDWHGNVINDFTLVGSGNDVIFFTIDENNMLTLNSAANYEMKSYYKINILATDKFGNSILKTLEIHLNDSNKLFLLFVFV